MLSKSNANFPFGMFGTRQVRFELHIAGFAHETFLDNSKGAFGIDLVSHAMNLNATHVDATRHP
ncbi:MAG: hypothetical protein NVS1B11_19060 [Terriglobales bacterium]